MATDKHIPFIFITILSLLITSCNPQPATPTVDLDAAIAQAIQATQAIETEVQARVQATLDAQVTQVTPTALIATATPFGSEAEAIALITGDPRFPIVSFHKNGEIFAVMGSATSSGGIQEITGMIWVSAEGEAITFYFGSNGLPTHAVAADHLVAFSNYTQDTVDMTFVSPEGKRDFIAAVPIDLSPLRPFIKSSAAKGRGLQSPPSQEWSAAEALQFASIAFGVFSCVATFASGGTLGVIFGVGCAATLISIWSAANPENSQMVGNLGVAGESFVCAGGVTLRAATAAADCAALVTDVASKFAEEAEETEGQLSGKLTPPTPTFTPTASIATLYLEKDYHCRSGPGKVYDILWSLTAGETLKILGKDGTGWWLVELNDPRTRTKTCWIGGGEVSGSESSISLAPIPPTPTPKPAVFGIGSIRVDKLEITLYIRDYKDVDGDRVRIRLNGSTIVGDYTLTGSPYAVGVTLKPGENTLVVTALNEGSSSPNTFEISFTNVVAGQSTFISTDLLSGQSISITIMAP
jgi:hypothetical protein